MSHWTQRGAEPQYTARSLPQPSYLQVNARGKRVNKRSTVHLTTGITHNQSFLSTPRSSISTITDGTETSFMSFNGNASATSSRRSASSRRRYAYLGLDQDDISSGTSVTYTTILVGRTACKPKNGNRRRSTGTFLESDDNRRDSKFSMTPPPSPKPEELWRLHDHTTATTSRHVAPDMRAAALEVALQWRIAGAEAGLLDPIITAAVQEYESLARRQRYV